MPQGDCYRAAFEYATTFGLTLCHGQPLGTGGPVEGKRYGHAWVETGGGFVMEVANDRRSVVDVETYYAAGAIVGEDVKRYSMEEALTWALRTGHYGPWENVASRAEA